MTLRGTAPALVVLAAMASNACNGHPPSRVTFGSLGGDIARIGNVSIPTSLAAHTAAGQHVTPSAALAGLVEDALLAEGARAIALDRTPRGQWAFDSLLARVATERLREESLTQGPPTDEELATLTVVHAVVRASAFATDARAMEVAQTIARTVAGARSDDEFLSRARATPHAPAPVISQRVGPFDVSGGTPGGVLDPEFVAAAFSLHRPGETSGIVRTPFGFHVIRLVARTPPAPADADTMRQELAQSVRQLRVRISVARVLATLRAKATVEVATSADTLMAQAAAQAP